MNHNANQNPYQYPVYPEPNTEYPELDRPVLPYAPV